MASENTAVHLLAGGAGGTAGAVITCPLEVVKTRLQSSVAHFSPPVYANKTPQTLSTAQYSTCASTSVYTHTTASSTARTNLVTHQSRALTSIGIYRCLKHIVESEGPRALFKGLGPNLVGVAPSRAVYFYAYAQTKSYLNTVISPETPLVHICSASMAGFTASTLTNPIWFIKTRLQLDQRKHNRITIRQCVHLTWRQLGWRGFYKGITASYYGISETVIHFVIYEAIKARVMAGPSGGDQDGEEYCDDRTATDFLKFMAAGATSKTVATCVAYPHEVARTRLREEGNKYRGFWQTLSLVWEQEGSRGLYRGLATQLVRQIPNTAIMMATYEAVVYLCSKHLAQNQYAGS